MIAQSDWCIIRLVHSMKDVYRFYIEINYMLILINLCNFYTLGANMIRTAKALITIHFNLKNIIINFYYTNIIVIIR